RGAGGPRRAVAPAATLPAGQGRPRGAVRTGVPPGVADRARRGARTHPGAHGRGGGRAMSASTSVRLLGDLDLHLLAEGTHLHASERRGAHPGAGGTHFAVWAPNARGASVVGDFNGWSPDATPLSLRPEAGVWEAVVPGVQEGARYKF